MLSLRDAKPDCTLGFSTQFLEGILSTRDYANLQRWMDGQTGAICDGRVYNHETKQYEPSECADNPHGVVYYAHDVRRWALGLPVID